MIRKLKRFFESAEPVEPEDVSSRIQVATCVLLLEVAHSDNHFSDEEREHIVEYLKEDFQLSEEYAHELLELAQQKRDESADLWRFTNEIDTHYSPKDKERVIETLWRVVYADDRLHFYEDHLIHRLSRLMNLSHKQLIDAKKRVMGWE